MKDYMTQIEKKVSERRVSKKLMFRVEVGEEELARKAASLLKSWNVIEDFMLSVVGSDVVLVIYTRQD